MSLVLRKKCQPVLDSAGLGNYHVAMSSNLNLLIAGECGQPLIVISGIAFSKKAPTNGEIDYAVELLQDFVDSHLPTIKAFNKSVIDANKLKIPQITPDFSVDVNYRNEVNGIKYLDDIMSISISSKGTTIRCFDLPVKPITVYRFSTVLHKKALAYLAKYRKYAKAKRDVEVITETLSSCDI